MTKNSDREDPFKLNNFLHPSSVSPVLYMSVLQTLFVSLLSYIVLEDTSVQCCACLTKGFLLSAHPNQYEIQYKHHQTIYMYIYVVYKKNIYIGKGLCAYLFIILEFLTVHQV